MASNGELVTVKIIDEEEHPNSENPRKKPQRTISALGFEEVTLCWEHVKFEVDVKGKDGKAASRVLLNDISGLVKPHELLAIMGPSGAGKSTMLDFLADRIASSSGRLDGEVMVNGKERDSNYNKIMAYVAQEDHLYGSLTVRETIAYAARLNLSSLHHSRAEKNKMVDEIISELGLDRVANKKIGSVFYSGVSGGQRRRVSIGVELVTNPSLLFLDEPTSGLDSTSSFKVVEKMRDLARHGRTVVATIHQPEAQVLNMFDKLLMLSEGEVVYSGPVKDLVPYFSAQGHVCPVNRNPSAFCMKIINNDFYAEGEERDRAKEIRQKLVDHYRSSDNYRSDIQQIEEYKGDLEKSKEGLSKHDQKVAHKAHKRQQREARTNFMEQYLVLTDRCFLNAFRNPLFYGVRLFMFTALAFVIGTNLLNLGYDDQSITYRQGILFYIVAFFVFMSIAAIPAFIEERAVYLRERTNGHYEVGPYISASSTVSIPFLVVITLVASSVMYFAMNLLQTAGAFFYFNLLLFLALYCGEAIVQLAATIFPIFILAVLAAAFIYGYFMYCMGFAVLPFNMPKFWLYLGYYPSMYTYVYAGFMTNEFVGLTFTTERFCSPSPCQSTGQDVLNYLAIPGWSKWWNVLIVAAMCVFYRFQVYIVLRLFYSGKK